MVALPFWSISRCRLIVLRGMSRMTSALRLIRVGVPLVAVTLLGACGGGGADDPVNTVTNYQVTASAGTGGTISPPSATVNAGGTTMLTVTANSGYAISSVTGCGGSLSGTAYTTGAINANCAVTASFVAQYTVTATAGSGGTISPPSATVNAGGTTMLTVTANSGYAISSVTGCGGSLSGTAYTTGAINANCAVTASFILQYAVTATAGAGGMISPASVAVNAGSTTGFTVTPNSGYVVTGVTGCGGTLSGNTYTTGAINGSCTVSASYSPAFTWVGGSNSSDVAGVYGTLGVAATTNLPGGRHSPITWTDATGNLWLFGGFGVGSTMFNDTWKYSPTSSEWTWINGYNFTNGSGAYGTLGVGLPSNVPGAHGASATWTDASGNQWFFGGYGFDAVGAQGWLNSLWKYSPSSGTWTWIGGSSTISAPGVYGTRGVAAPANVPGARAVGGGMGAGGNVWLFAGFGYDSNGALGSLNDLWEYSPSSGEWTWVGGANTTNAMGVYGTQGVPANSNQPGARYGGATWIDANGNLWVFGGVGYDSTGAHGELNDLWEYSSATGMWTWINGSNTVNVKGVYGTQRTAATTNVPGARYDVGGFTDTAGNLWLYGGAGFDSAGNFAVLNDLWKFSPASGEWTWVSGANTVNASAVYGTQGVAAIANTPGARENTVYWVDSSGTVWLFGGEGINASGGDPNTPQWNDLWKFPTQ
jgi:N-acetylneuraminic acid mutarotase